MGDLLGRTVFLVLTQLHHFEQGAENGRIEILKAMITQRRIVFTYFELLVIKNVEKPSILSDSEHERQR